MAKSANLSEKEVLEVLQRELGNFKKLVKGHENILNAIGEL